MPHGSTQIDLFSFYFATVGYFVSLTVIVGDLRWWQTVDSVVVIVVPQLGLGDELKGPQGEMDELKGPPEVIARGSSLDIIRLHTDWSENECILYPQFQWMSHCPHNTSLFFAPVSDTPIDHCGCNRFTIIICAIVFVDIL